MKIIVVNKEKQIYINIYIKKKLFINLSKPKWKTNNNI